MFDYNRGVSPHARGEKLPMDAMNMSPADQNDGAATEMINPSDEEKHSPEDTSQEEANDEGAEEESAKPH
jgi:hypothetical protein